MLLESLVKSYEFKFFCETAMTELQISEYLKELEDNLLGKQKLPIRLDFEWVKEFPFSPGIYAIFENDKIIYVGETGSIRKRMNDLRNTLNHTFRRTTGEILFSTREDYRKASSSIKYPDNIEKELENWMKRNLSISYLCVKLGRKELEELIIDRNPKILNKRIKRKQN